MSHIPFPEGLPGITGPMIAYPVTAKPLNELAHTLLMQESATFSTAERETLASYVSYLNECQFCSECHAAAADYHWQEQGRAKQIWEDYERAPLSERFKALMKIAACVQRTGKAVEKADVIRAMECGATEQDIHDAVLIAAAFCMYNRYVDGLGTFAPPRNDPAYVMIGKRLGSQGYVQSID